MDDDRCALVSWIPPPPPGHSCHTGYKLTVTKKGEEKPQLQRVVQLQDKLKIEPGELTPAVEYEFSITSIASGKQDNMDPEQRKLPKTYKEESTPFKKSFVLDPLPPLDLKLEASTPSSLKVKWEPPQEQGTYTYVVSVKVT